METSNNGQKEKLTCGKCKHFATLPDQYGYHDCKKQAEIDSNYTLHIKHDANASNCPYYYSKKTKQCLSQSEIITLTNNFLKE